MGHRVYVHTYNQQTEVQKNVLDSGLLLELGTFRLVINVVFIILAEAIQETQNVVLIRSDEVATKG